MPSPVAIILAAATALTPVAEVPAVFQRGQSANIIEYTPRDTGGEAVILAGGGLQLCFNDRGFSGCLRFDQENPDHRNRHRVRPDVGADDQILNHEIAERDERFFVGYTLDGRKAYNRTVLGTDGRYYCGQEVGNGDPHLTLLYPGRC
jgi:hypothetical protein